MPEASRPVRYQSGVPVHGYRNDPAIPPVSVWRLTAHELAGGVGPHIHDFPALLYLPRTGEIYVVAIGHVVDRTAVGAVDEAFAVFFDPAALGDDGRGPWPAWRTHPLLFPFVHGAAGGMLRLRAPAARRGLWQDTITAIDQELTRRGFGYRQAAQAHLTVLLIDVARLADDVVGDLRRSHEPMLAAVFDIIEQRYDQSLSLRDVARTVSMTPGHLTTVVRRRTGRTVQDWIIERRMAEARALLADTDLPIAEIARSVGLPDPGYFARVFRRAHGMAPRHWRGRHVPGRAEPPAPPRVDARPAAS
ncbi:helix-turn-helix transcriptional regulator [Nocardia sp. NPDC006044]|uniref:helix-turn-helix transcriptional regulator n=1 Tax=Nocardia sp. NPDC006044 TaxID=3364306 RepID=UPI003694CBE5